MQEVTLNWEGAGVGEEAPSGEGDTYTLVVPLERQVPWAFVRALTEQLDATAGEVRGGRWGDASVNQNEIAVHGVGPGSEKALKEHLNGSLAHAHERFRDYERRRAESMRAREEHAQERRRTADDMTAAFREP